MENFFLQNKLAMQYFILSFGCNQPRSFRHAQPCMLGSVGLAVELEGVELLTVEARSD